MDLYPTAIVELAVELLFWIKGVLTKKPRAAGRPSVPLVPPKQGTSTI
jgi:hypothetical protein